MYLKVFESFFPCKDPCLHSSIPLTLNPLTYKPPPLQDPIEAQVQTILPWTFNTTMLVSWSPEPDGIRTVQNQKDYDRCFKRVGCRA